MTFLLLPKVKLVRLQRLSNSFAEFGGCARSAAGNYFAVGNDIAVFKDFLRTKKLLVTKNFLCDYKRRFDSF